MHGALHVQVISGRCKCGTLLALARMMALAEVQRFEGAWNPVGATSLPNNHPPDIYMTSVLGQMGLVQLKQPCWPSEEA